MTIDNGVWPFSIWHPFLSTLASLLATFDIERIAPEALLFQSGYLTVTGLDVTVEDSGSRGRLDLAVRLPGRVYLFEFKVVESAGAGAAMAQLRERDYAAKYRGLGDPIHLVGVEFSRESRNIAAFDVAVG